MDVKVRVSTAVVVVVIGGLQANCDHVKPAGPKTSWWSFFFLKFRAFLFFLLVAVSFGVCSSPANHVSRIKSPIREQIIDSTRFLDPRTQ
jgi:hypothetical protein